MPCNALVQRFLLRLHGADVKDEAAFDLILSKCWASFVAQLVKNLPAMRRPGFDPWVGKIPWRRDWLPTPEFSPGEFHGLYSPWGRKEPDMTERLSLSLLDIIMSMFRLGSPKRRLSPACSASSLSCPWWRGRGTSSLMTDTWCLHAVIRCQGSSDRP